MNETTRRAVQALVVLGAVLGGCGTRRPDSQVGDDEDCAGAIIEYNDTLGGCGYDAPPLSQAEALDLCTNGPWGGCLMLVDELLSCMDTQGCARLDICQSLADELTTCLNEENGGCSWVQDGECDEPEGTGLCPEGSDVADCTGSGGGGGGSCAWTGDGECDEPEGTGLCPDGSDVADCGGGDGGGGGGCDPSACSGSTSECTEYGCVTCYSFCSDGACQFECNDPY